MLLDSDFNDIILMIIYIIFGVNDIFFLYKLTYFYQRAIWTSWGVLWCPRVSWGIKTDRSVTDM